MGVKKASTRSSISAVLWAWCTVRDGRAGETLGKRMAVASALLIAPAVWWYLSAQITTDWLFIVHNWPAPFSSQVKWPLLAWAEIFGVVLAVAGLSDLVDGTVARRFERPSTLGGGLDPIVDGILLGAVVVGLSLSGSFPF